MFNLPIGLINMHILVTLAVSFALCCALFLSNRMNVRANEQIRLLRQIAEQQQQQIALLEHLLRGKQQEKGSEPELAFQFKGIVPER